MVPWTLKIGQMKLDIYGFMAGLFESHLDSRVDSVEVQPWREVHNVLFTSPSVQSQVRCVGQGAGAVLFNIILFLDIHHREWRFTARCKTHCHLQIRKLVEKMLNLSQNVWKFAKKLLCFDSRTIGFLNTDTRGLFCNWRFNWEDYGENCDYLYFKILRYYAEMFCVFMSKFMVY